MNIFVFIKRVPDTESRIRIDHDAGKIAEDDLNFIISPYDEYAVEEALRLKEASGGSVTVFSVGPDEAQVVLKKALAMGADEAVLIKDDLPESYDGSRAARIIAAALRSRWTEYDLLLFGKQSFGADNAQVPGMVAGMLDLPQVNVVTRLEIEGAAGTAYREIEGALEKVSFSLPAVLSAQKGLNDPRYETLKGIMMAKRKSIPVVTPEELGLTEDDLQPRLALTALAPPPARQAGQVVEGEPADTAKRLARFLHEDAKVI